jgi:transcriptional regulator with XRE-family HTH domain
MSSTFRLCPIPLKARKRLRREREKRKWPLTKVAQKLEVSQEQVSRWETGDRGCDSRTLTRYAAILDLDIVITEAKVNLTSKKELIA